MADYKKPDYWQQKARKEGYPARSVYKLMEIDEKFSLFKINRANFNAGNPFRVLDIGAAPGSWSLYVLQKFARGCISYLKNGFLAAADLSPLSGDLQRSPALNKQENDADLKSGNLINCDNFFFIQGDITTEETRKVILSKGPYSVIISDAAPNTTGNHMIDSARSLDLAETAAAYAEDSLISGGNLALKIFQGSGTDILLKRMRTLFETAKSFKPQACRGESVETYFIGLGKI